MSVGVAVRLRALPSFMFVLMMFIVIVVMIVSCRTMGMLQIIRVLARPKQHCSNHRQESHRTQNNKSPH